jgi:hypothetical protein
MKFSSPLPLSGREERGVHTQHTAAHLYDALRLVPRKVRHIWRTVEVLSDTMTTVRAHDTEAMLLSMLADDLPEFSITSARFDHLNRLMEALVGYLNTRTVSMHAV